MHRPLARLRLAVAPGLAATLLAACAPQGVTPSGAPGEILYGIFLVAAAVVFVVVAGLIGLSILRYRERDDGTGAAGTRASVRLELLWWAIPTALVIVLFLLAAQVLGAVDERSDDPAVTTTVSQLRSSL
jgi:heme/copper-type cytochrome/quinol oxidase subunit 2